MFSKTVFDQKQVMFLKEVKEGKWKPEPLYTETAANFAGNWDRETGDWSAMIDKSLHSNISQRLWKGVDYFPKEMLIQFAGRYPYLIREIFDDLFDERKDVTGRLGRFVFHFDQLLAMLAEEEAQQTWRAHYHNEFVASLFLTWTYPEKYTFFLPAMFVEAMPMLGARKQVHTIAPDSYFTLMATMRKLILSAENVPASLQTPFCSLEFLFWLTKTRQV